MVAYFERLGCPSTIIVVNDGSTRDDTRQAADGMARAFPGRVQAVHHPRNAGYGAALRTGIRTALASGHQLIGFCDADGQFEIESFGTLLAALQDARADGCAGYRLVRADSLARRVMGRGWHWLSGLALGTVVARDVDCGFKVFTCPLLAMVEPQIRGGYAAVSPEILARAAAAGFVLTEAGVRHQPRAAGRQTGADPKVVLWSLLRLCQLRLTLRKEKRHGRPSHPAGSARPAPEAAAERT